MGKYKFMKITIKKSIDAFFELFDNRKIDIDNLDVNTSGSINLIFILNNPEVSYANIVKLLKKMSISSKNFKVENRDSEITSRQKLTSLKKFIDQNPELLYIFTEKEINKTIDKLYTI